MGRKSLLLKTLVALTVSAGMAHSEETCRLAILGDSLSSGYGVEASEAFPTVLQDNLSEHGLSCDIINAGVSGDTTAGGASRISWVLSNEPTHLLVELGGNDALRGLPVEQMESNLSQIIETSLDQNIPVMLAGMIPPPNLGEAYTVAFSSTYRRLANEYDLYLYPFFLEGVALEPDLMQPDGIHPNERGVREIVDRIRPMVTEFLTTRVSKAE